MRALVDAGFVTFDLADHYGPAEDFVGAFVQSSPGGKPPLVSFHTKWVPSPGEMSETTVRRAMDVSRRKMREETLDLVAFHWWDYSDKRYLNLLRNAQKMSTTADAAAPAALHSVALTNFDTDRLKEIVDSGVKIVSNQARVAMFVFMLFHRCQPASKLPLFSCLEP
jgi:aryl-alcohol dehydrogenase-like predicted oxidoreductase